ncbi:MAG TPA: hypothetical protein VKZ89_02225 [Thermobifida alba]|nr:hypothetical protein [Thermobifida alba]
MAGLLVLVLLGFVIWMLVRIADDPDGPPNEGGSGIGIGRDDDDGGGWDGE